MKKLIAILLLGALLISCGTEVKPNYYGVLKENYGKNGKSDYTVHTGNVSTTGAGTELFQVPAFEQRAEFYNKDGTKRTLHLLSADNTALTANPLYSYAIIKEKVVDVVFQNSQLESGENFMSAIQTNILEPMIYDVVKKESRTYPTDSLMASGGSLTFEQRVQTILTKEFAEKGFTLSQFSINLDFTEKVKAKIDTRNEANTNISVLDQNILEQKKKNELAALQRDFNLIQSAGITPQLLQQQFIEKWDGKTTLYGIGLPVTLFKKIE